MLAHELRNPLAPIRTAVQLMRFKELPEEQRVRARDIIERQVDQLVRLIDDLMDVSRITRGMITLHREPIDVTTVDRPRGRDRAPADRCTTAGAGGGAAAARRSRSKATRTRLAQVIGNVLNNASKYTPEDGHIRLQLHAEERPGGDHGDRQRHRHPARHAGQRLRPLHAGRPRARSRRTAASASGSRWCAGSSRCTAGGSAPRAAASTREPRSRSTSADRRGAAAAGARRRRRRGGAAARAAAAPHPGGRRQRGRRRVDRAPAQARRPGGAHRQRRRRSAGGGGGAAARRRLSRPRDAGPERLRDGEPHPPGALGPATWR